MGEGAEDYGMRESGRESFAESRESFAESFENIIGTKGVFASTIQETTSELDMTLHEHGQLRAREVARRYCSLWGAPMD